MPTTRREFLHSAAAAGAVLGLAPAARSAPATQPTSRADKRLNLLILGGTGFLGPHTVEAALARGHTITLFNRGRTNTDLFPNLEKLRGNRDPEVDEGLTALEGREWDAVIDTSAYVPRVARASATLLAPNVQQYVFISTISVFASFKENNMDETAPVGTLEDESVEEVNGLTYGPLKALCEQAVEKEMPGRTTVIRPGLIVGPLDPTDRFTYWPMRVKRGGEVLSPGNPDDPVKYIDARDLAEWTIYTIEQNITGIFNAVGPRAKFTMAELLYGCKAVTGGDATFSWVDAEFLTEHSVAPWSSMPVWVPPVGEYQGMGTVSREKAFENGMPFRPLADTVRDTLQWVSSLSEERQREFVTCMRELPNGKRRPRPGVTSEKEAEVLAAWHARQADQATSQPAAEG